MNKLQIKELSKVSMKFFIRPIEINDSISSREEYTSYALLLINDAID